MKASKGFTMPAVIVAVVLVVAAILVGVMALRPNTTPENIADRNETGDTMKQGDGQAMGGGEAMEKPEGDAMEKKDEAMVDGNDSGAMEKKEAMPLEFSGTKLAGTTSPLLDFNKADYDKAVASDKLVVLYFYANWCPICRAEFPKAEAAFNKLTGDQVVGFRVNFNDNQTDDDEKELARQFGVAYQHTKVFLRNGQRTLKSPETWEQERYLQEIEKAR